MLNQKEKELVQKMDELTHEYCEVLDKFYELIDENDYEFSDEKNENMVQLRAYADDIYREMDNIKDSKDIIVKTREDIQAILNK